MEKDEIVDEDYLVMELDIVDNELAIKQINDDKIAMIVTDMLLKKFRNIDNNVFCNTVSIS